MNAESIAVALGGRKTSRGWRVPCPALNPPEPEPELDLAYRNCPDCGERSCDCDAALQTSFDEVHPRLVR